MNKKLLEKKYSAQQIDQIIRFLIEHVTKKSYAQFLANPKLTEVQEKELDNLIDLHVNKNKPLQYILGSVDFIDSKILVEPPILIPRPETEEWVYNLSQQFKDQYPITGHPERAQRVEGLKIVDIGTGTGCIAISLAKFFKSAQIFALDINDKALELAKKNAKLNNIRNITFVKSDVFSNFNEKVDLIISNPPYINEKDYQNLDKSVKDWEDKTALTTKEDGLFVIRQIIEGAGKHLRNTIFKDLPKIFLEIDSKQAKQVCDLLEKNGFKGQILNDFAGKNRVCVGS